MTGRSSGAGGRRSPFTSDRIKKVLLALIAVFVLAPASLLLLVATFFAPLPLLAGSHVMFVTFTLAGGWLGFAALVRLCDHFFKSDSLPAAPGKAAFGLVCGTASVLVLVSSSAAPLRSPLLLACAPLLSGLVFGYLLWRSWRAARPEATPSP
jgi:hypothetical protein